MMCVPTVNSTTFGNTAVPVPSSVTVASGDRLLETGSVSVKVTVPEGTTPMGVGATTNAVNINSWPETGAKEFDVIVVVVPRTVASWIAWQNSEVFAFESVAVAVI